MLEIYGVHKYQLFCSVSVDSINNVINQKTLGAINNLCDLSKKKTFATDFEGCGGKKVIKTVDLRD